MDVTEVRNKLTEIRKLPACPDIIPKALKLSQDPNTPMSEYEKLVAKDPALVAEILRSVNSPFYGLRSQISTLKLAMNIVGLQEIFRILLNASFHRTFRSTFDKLSYNFEIFWKHSQITANTAMLLSKSFNPTLSSEAYICGLLHDIGIPIMEQFFYDEWMDVILLAEEGRDFLNAEQEVFGLTHAEIGAQLLRNWNIPESIITPVSYHHYPHELTPPSDLVNIVYFADKTATNFMKDMSENVTQEKFEKDEIWQTMLSRYPHFAVLDDEKFIEEIKPVVTQQLIGGS